MVLSGGMLTGCSNSSNTKDTKTTEVAKKEVKTLGKKTKDSKSLKITNSTGKKITVFETKSSSEESFSDNLLDDGDAVKNKEERTLYYTVKENDKLDVKVGLEDQDETAKADSSNKSNTSESKKNNTASTSNSSSNKNNSSSSSSKPTEHTHNWVAQYKTVNVPEQGHNEQVLVQAAYDEQVPITEMKAYSICSTCGADITGNTSAHVKNHVMIGDDKGGYYTEWRETVVGYNTVHHDAVYETRYVVDSPATTKQELTGYKCSGCGKTKAN